MLPFMSMEHSRLDAGMGTRIGALGRDQERQTNGQWNRLVAESSPDVEGNFAQMN
jgi:hypothetical protein